MSRPSTGKVKVNTFMDAKILEALRIIGHARGVTYSELIREACRRFVMQEGGKVVAEKMEYNRLGVK